MRIGVQMRRHVRLLTILFAISIASPGGSSSPAGTAIGVIPEAQGTLDGQSAMMAAGDGVFLGQNVITGNAGQVQIVFSDDTHLVIGPQASLVISQYLMRNDGSASKFVVDALGGTFRFMTGKSPKNAYQIKTPTGTLGVRGTAFDFTVEPGSGKTTVLLYHGGVRMCGAGGCTELSESCAVGVLAKRTAAKVVGPHDKRRPPLLKDFPYLVSQQPLKAAFRVKQTGPCKASATAAAAVERNIQPAASEPPPSETPSSEQPSSQPPSSQPPASEPSSRPPSHEPSSSSSSASSSSSSSVPPPSGPPPDHGHGNNGYGNGGDDDDEGNHETGNPGHGGNGEHGNGWNGNGGNNGGHGNGNGFGNGQHGNGGNGGGGFGQHH